MAYKKGQSGNPKGRKPGTVNKVTASMREAFMLAFAEIGGTEALAKWAKENPEKFYPLAAKLIPQSIEGTGGFILTVRYAERNEPGD